MKDPYPSLSFCYFAFLMILCTSIASAQTSGLTYQGRLTDNMIAANGTYQMQFTLFNSVSGGTQIGSTADLTNVDVTNGVFTVTLDFGTTAFTAGANRYLEIAVRRNAGEVYTLLAPRQQVTSTPYSIRSLSTGISDDSNRLGGLNSTLYVIGSDPRLSDARTPTAGSNNYIQNRATTQSGSNFDISGVGEANILVARTQYNLGNSRILSSPGTLNTLVGINNGNSLTSGSRNTFVGRNTGSNTTSGENNTFVGSGAGFENIGGTNNSFYGLNSGLRVTSGSQNSIFGVSAGGRILTTSNNSLFGFETGLNATNHDNSFFGASAGRSTTSGGSNAFFGKSAGENNTTGSNNTFVGNNAGTINTTGSNNTFIGEGAGPALDNMEYATAIGAGAVVQTPSQVQLGRDDIDTVRFGRLPNASTTLCVLGLFNVPARCSSSIRFKKDVTDFGSAIDLIRKLRPVSFRWKETEMPDLGLIAEEVAAVEPLLATYGKDGEIQGVKYKLLGVVLINVVKEQHDQIETQNKLIEEQSKANQSIVEKLNSQQNQIDELKQIVCSLKSGAGVCKEEER